MGASSYIIHKWPGHLPPGSIYIDMFTGMIDKSRFACYFRAMAEGMEDYLVKSFAKSNINKLFKVCWTMLPVVPTCQRFRSHKFLPVDMSCTGSLFSYPEALTVPEFTHGNVRIPQGLQGINPRVSPVSGLSNHLKAMFIGNLH